MYKRFISQEQKQQQPKDENNPIDKVKLKQHIDYVQDYQAKQKFKNFRMLCVGMSQSGKTYNIMALLQHMIDKRKINKNNIIWFSQNWMHDVEQLKFIQRNEIPQQNLHTDLEPTILNKLVETQKSKIKNKKPIEQYILFIDDQAANPDRSLEKGPLLSMCIGCRHISISTIVLTQKLTRTVSPIYRNQCNYIFLHRISELKTLKDTLEQYSGLLKSEGGNADDLFKIYSDNLKEDDGYGSLCIQTEAKKINQAFSLSLRRILNDM